MTTPLAVRSAGSLLRGRVDAARLAETAAARGYSAFALADRDGLYQSVRFVQACREKGVRPVVGVEISDGPAGKAQAERRLDPPALALAFARDRAGYAALCRLVSARHRDPDRAPEDAIAEAAAGGSVHVVAREADGAARLASSLEARGVRPRERLWLGVAAPGPGGSRAREAREQATRLGIVAVASGRVRDVGPQPAGFARTLAALRRNVLVAHVAAEDLEDGLAATGGALGDGALADAAAWRASWERAGDEAQAALRANAALVADCTLELSLGTPRFPSAPVPAGETAYSYLYARCHVGLTRRYQPVPRNAVRRLATELETIDRLGFTPYFVLVADIVGFAQQRGIPTVGRGSGAASIVAYVLGITNVDPLRYRLAFERFLHSERRDCPDLDIDLCWVRRDEVIEHVYRTYGDARVAMISTHCTLGARGAFREATKAHGLAPDEIDRLARFVPHEPEEPLETLLAPAAARADIALGAPEWRAALADAAALVGTLDHLGVHPGGLVLADTALEDYTPLEPATKGIVVTQLEMRQIEALGLVKMDLLGNRCLSEIGDTLRWIERSGVTPPRIDSVAHDDAVTARQTARGDTLSVFQLESPGMRNLLRMLDARTLDDAIAAIALIRPGPAGSGMKDLYVRRQRGLAETAPPHPKLAALLEPQRGVLLFEEDVMAVVALVCGVTLGQGDLFRRALAGTRTLEERAPLARWFVARARAGGLSAADAERVWGEVARFGAYAFCRAHAAGYGVLAWQAAFLRAHWPAAFATALGDHHAGMYALWVHVADLQRHGVRFALPCVNRSQAGFTLEGDAVTGPVRVGLGRVRDVENRTVDVTLAARASGGPFTSLADWLGRVRPSSGEAERLVHAGALDFTGRTRAALALEVAATETAYARAEDEGAFRVRTAPIDVGDLPEFDARGKLVREWNALELCVGAHPLAVFAPEITDVTAGGFDTAASLETRAGERVRVCGLFAAGRRVPTKQGGRMFFLTLDDGTGVVECTLFPDAYRRSGTLLTGMGPFVVEGRVESQYGAITVNAERCVPYAESARVRTSRGVTDPQTASRTVSPPRANTESRWGRPIPFR